MRTTLEPADTARAHRLAAATLRLRLKPAHRLCGFVQGAWWPRSTNLADELPSLLDALAPRFGAIDRVRYHESDWWPAASNMTHPGGNGPTLEVGTNSPNVVTFLGSEFGAMSLLVVPPNSDVRDAYISMTTAASIDDTSAPEQLMTLGRLGADADAAYAEAVLQRWETEGGAVLDPV